MDVFLAIIIILALAMYGVLFRMLWLEGKLLKKELDGLRKTR